MSPARYHSRRPEESPLSKSSYYYLKTLIHSTPEDLFFVHPSCSTITRTQLPRHREREAKAKMVKSQESLYLISGGFSKYFQSCTQDSSPEIYRVLFCQPFHSETNKDRHRKITEESGWKSTIKVPSGLSALARSLFKRKTARHMFSKLLLD